MPIESKIFDFAAFWEMMAVVLRGERAVSWIRHHDGKDVASLMAGHHHPCGESWGSEEHASLRL